MSKQDRQGVRTPADLERKYPLGRIKNGGDTSELSNQITQLNQSLAIFEASTNGSIAQMTDDIADLEQAVAELEQGGGGGEASLFLVTVEVDSLATETLTADKTFSDIEEAILAGMDVKVKLISSSESYHIYMQLAAHLTGSEVDFSGYYNGQTLSLQIMADE